MTITKEFLALMWRAKLLDTQNLTLTTDEPIQINSMGLPVCSSHVGGDIQNVSYTSTLKNVRHYGSVKFNINSSDWYDEQTINQAEFSNIVLHVVNHCDTTVIRNGVAIDTLVLDIDPALLERRHRLPLECRPFFAELDSAYQENVLSRMAADRMYRKSQEIIDIFNSVHQNWERTAMITMIRSLGIRNSKKPYEELARKVPFHVVQSMKNDTASIEALLFGQAGYLIDDQANDPYYLEVLEKYKEIKVNFKLDQRPIEWNTVLGIKNSLSRMWGKPKNNPKIRPKSMTSIQLARTAAILSSEASLFERILQERDYQKLRDIFSVPLNKYWKSHSSFGVAAKLGENHVPELRVSLFIINFVAPLLNAYGTVTKNDEVRDWSIETLLLTPQEINTYTKPWKESGFVSKSAFQSQGIIQIESILCRIGKCENCPIGSHMISDFYKELAKYPQN